MSPQCYDKGKKNYQIEKIHVQRFDCHEISQILIKSTTNIFDISAMTFGIFASFTDYRRGFLSSIIPQKQMSQKNLQKLNDKSIS